MRMFMLPALLGVLTSSVFAQTGMFEMARSASPSPGQCSYSQTAEASEARFGTIVAIRCIRASQLVAIRRLDVPAQTVVTIATDLAVRSIPASGMLGAADPLLDAIAFSRGRFVVEAAGSQRLVVPASPEAARSIEDCRN